MYLLALGTGYINDGRRRFHRGIYKLKTARPRGNFEGRVESSFYTVNDGTVLLVEESGVPVDRHKLARKLKPAEDARAVACALTRVAVL
jgi:hypothetical protein